MVTSNPFTKTDQAANDYGKCHGRWKRKYGVELARLLKSSSKLGHEPEEISALKGGKENACKREHRTNRKISPARQYHKSHA